MRFDRRAVRTLLAAGMLLMCMPITARSQTPTPTPEQIEVFRSLPREQQQEILEQFRQQDGPTAGTPGQDVQTSQPKAAVDEESSRKLLAELERELRLQADDSLIITVELVGEPDRARNEFVRNVRNGNPYRLDRTGRLVLPDDTAIVLAGLGAGAAASRLNTEPRLRGFRFDVKLLPVEPELKPFGYELFQNVPTTFAPATDIPVPSDYVLGPGDTLELQLIGERGGRHTLMVGRDGTVSFPELGPVAVAGLRFEAAKELLESRVSEQMIGLRASISMGALRSIQIFMLGEAERPGSYTVSGLSTITNALFSSGGVKANGSLRNIQLKRNGQLVRRLDLYDLLLRGDTSDDQRLLSGDVIFVPPVGPTVGITGEVQRPAIYEVREGTTATDAINLAGGLTPQADPRTLRLERIDERLNKTVVDLDLTTPVARTFNVQAGDHIRIHPIRNSIEGAVWLEGHVHRPGSVKYRAGMRLVDLVGSYEELKPLADLRYVLIRRESDRDRRVTVISADLAAAFADPASNANVALQARDVVHVFDLSTSRDRVTLPIIQDLGRQSSHEEPRQIVGIDGSVRVPGQYPLEPGMRISDLLRAGGGLGDAAYLGSAELTRYEVVNGETRQAAVMSIELTRVLSGDESMDLLLQPFDQLAVREISLWGDRETVTISGEVKFPGDYTIKRGETLQSVIERAGGITELAFARGSVFTRRELREREQRQLEVLTDRLQRDLALLTLQQAQSGEAANTTQAIAAGQQLLTDLKATKAVGRLVIELDDVLSSGAGSAADIIVKDGDRLFVPRRTQEVSVIGEVQNATSHLYQAELTRDDYIARSGGVTQRADSRRIFVIRANGQVDGASGSSWFSRGGARDIRPGDTVVVPLDAQQVKPLTVWTSVSQIIYNIAVAVAAVNSF